MSAGAPSLMPSLEEEGLGGGEAPATPQILTKDVWPGCELP